MTNSRSDTQGLGAVETPRSLAFCSHVVYKREVRELSLLRLAWPSLTVRSPLSLSRGQAMVVLDASKDPRFEDNLLVIGDPFIRFYAGTPVMHNGHVLGTLCILDTSPRDAFSEHSKELLKGLAHLVVLNIKQHKAKTG